MTYDYYLLAWLVGYRSGLPFTVARCSFSHRKCWKVIYGGLEGAPCAA